MALAVEWAVFVNGLDVSARMNRYIESIEATGNSGGKADSARLVFDDTDGRVMLPPKGAPVEIQIEGRQVFKGYTDAPECIISRGGGQTLEVACSGFDKTGKAKQAINLHKDDCTLKEFLEEAAQKAGIKGIKVDDELGKIKRPYWSARGRNFLHLGQALAEEFGATFKLRADQAVFAKRGEGTVPGGGSTPTITATRGLNLIEARIRPFEGRPRYAKARVRRYDRKKAKHITEDIEIGNAPGGGDVVDILGEGRPDEGSAKDAAKGRKTESEREGGSGSITILIEVDAEPEGTCILSGFRPGADGSYRIETRTHRVTRDGAETSLTVKQPQGDAGTDSRGSGGSSGE